MELFSKTSGKLTCIYGPGDPLILRADLTSIKNALSKGDPSQSRLSYVEIEDADNGFMFEQRASFNPNASAIGLKLLMNELTF